MNAAAKLIVKQGYLPLSIEALARAANASKALVYTYFATQYDLFNRLLQREIAGLAGAGVETAARLSDLEPAAILCGMLYFEYVAQRGPLLHILMTDLYLAEHIEPEATRVGRAILTAARSIGTQNSQAVRETNPRGNRNDCGNSGRSGQPRVS